MRTLTRRQVLQAVGGLLAASALNACAPKVVEKEKIVERTVVVEKEKPVEVTKIVEKEKEVTKVVEKQVTTVVEKEVFCKKDWVDGLAPVPKKYDKVIQCRVEFPGTYKFKEGENYTNNPLYNWVKENLKVEYVIHWQADGDVRTQKRAADIAAGTLPDLFDTSGTEFAQLIANDALAEIRAIWEATASPLNKQKRWYPDGKNWLDAWRGDKLYGVAHDWGGAYNVDNLGWIRQDWLDKLSLKPPETLDDLEKTLYAFKKNGLSPYGINACKRLITWYQSLDPIFGAYGVMPTCWRDKGDGKLVYDSLAPENKEALALLNKWYKDGILDPDFYTYNEGDAAKNLSDGKVGVCFAPNWAPYILMDMEKAFNTRFIIFPEPKGPGGKRGRKATSVKGSFMVYRKGVDPLVIEATLNHLNWEMEMNVNGLTKHNAWGVALTSGVGLFLEGYDWEWVTTKDATPEVPECEIKKGPYLTGEMMRPVGWHFDYMSYPEIGVDLGRPIVEWSKADPKTLNKPQRLYLRDRGRLRQMEGLEVIWSTLDRGIADEWLGVPTKTMAEKNADLSAMEQEYYISIVIGNKPVSAFDEFVASWKKNGGDAVTADVNAWYETVKKK